MPSILIRVALGAILVVGMVMSGSPRPPAASAAGEAVPDLAMAPLNGFRIQTINGRRLLRFTAMMVNVGAGIFEVRGSRPSTSNPMVMSQVLYESSDRNLGVARQIRTGAVGKWSGDGHDHWHVQEMMRYDLWGSSGTQRGAKVGFCFLDSDAYQLSLPGARSTPYYRNAMCGNSPSALSNTMGLSIGWGDEYTWDLAYQWVDITNLPSGSYTLRAKVDPYGYFLEQNEANQCAYTRISWTSGSNAVTVQSRGNGCVNDWSGTKFAADIQWLFNSGITVGCSADLYCTYNRVLRDQMASFLTRAFDLPATSTNFFTDDAGNRHETAINRLAASGITSGCAPGRYCPSGAVTRGQMASFLSRALELPASPRDYFTDDETSIHEGAINRVAAAGITFGCGGTSFCPNGAVTRGQMAAFLHRALTN